MIERKIYKSYAFKDDELEKSRINHEIYKELKDKAKSFYGTKEPTEEDLKSFVCYRCIESGYANKKYEILSNPHNFKTDELALICDGGNLCFGYRTQGRYIVIHTD